MSSPKIQISVVIPFYNGNAYLPRLLSSISAVEAKMCKHADFEIIMVNDSPTVDILIPNEYQYKKITILQNDTNQGIQKTRIHGMDCAAGEWIIFLDQDDELIPDGFQEQVALTQDADVVVGNGIYQIAGRSELVFASLSEMRHLIQRKKFIQIRNLIPSPGQCMIRKQAIPEEWKNSPLQCNGADDWMLWILLFCKDSRFRCNVRQVYIHHDSGNANLSLDLGKMRSSSLEMCSYLSNHLTGREMQNLHDAINFKYDQDTHQLTIKKLVKYRKTVGYNIAYKIIREIARRSHLAQESTRRYER